MSDTKIAERLAAIAEPIRARKQQQGVKRIHEKAMESALEGANHARVSREELRESFYLTALEVKSALESEGFLVSYTSGDSFILISWGPG